MSKYVDIPELSSDEVPDWATPEAWKATEQLVNKTARYFLDRIAKSLPSKYHGTFIVLDADRPDDYRLGEDEPAAKEEFWNAFGKDRRAVVLQIGYVVAY